MKLFKNYGVPKFLHKHIQQARLLFGINGPEWHITSSLSDKPGGNSDNTGSALLGDASLYLNAHLEFKNDLKPSNYAREIAVHEVGHVALAEMNHIVGEILECLDEPKKTHFQNLYLSAEERFLQRLSRAFVWYFWRKH